MASPQQRHVCVSCSVSRERSEYSSKQWKRRPNSRCKVCVSSPSVSPSSSSLQQVLVAIQSSKPTGATVAASTTTVTAMLGAASSSAEGSSEITAPSETGDARTVFDVDEEADDRCTDSSELSEDASLASSIPSGVLAIDDTDCDSDSSCSSSSGETGTASLPSSEPSSPSKSSALQISLKSTSVLAPESEDDLLRRSSTLPLPSEDDAAFLLGLESPPSASKSAFQRRIEAPLQPVVIVSHSDSDDKQQQQLTNEQDVLDLPHLPSSPTPSFFGSLMRRLLGLLPFYRGNDQANAMPVVGTKRPRDSADDGSDTASDTSAEHGSPAKRPRHGEGIDEIVAGSS